MVAGWYWRSLRSKVLYEYGVDIEELLDPSQVEFNGSSRTPSRFMSARIRDGPHLVALREDGSLAISLAFARILLRSSQFQESCVVIDGDSVEFVRRGMSVMSGHVVRIGSNVMPGLDVCVLSPGGEPIAVGTCLLPPRLSGTRSGPLVKIRAHEEISSDAAPRRRAGAGSK